MRKALRLLPVACAALALCAGSAAYGQDGAAETIGFKTFDNFCVHSIEWGDDPGLVELSESDLSSGERQAISSHGDTFSFYLVNEEPRVILGLQWRETQATSRQFRDGRLQNGRSRNVSLVEGRCVVFAWENIWEDMPSAMEALLGIEPTDTSRPDANLDSLMFINIENLRANPNTLQPMGYGVTRLNGSESEIDGTTMYRAMM